MIKIKQLLTCAILLFVISSIISAGAQIIYVDQNATGPVYDGSSWCSALKELYQAFALDPAPEEIRIADGIYLPDVSGLSNPREATFFLNQSQNIKGGYGGCNADDPDDWNPDLYPTILSGDLAGDDPPDRINPRAMTSDENLTDNAYHVISTSGFDTVVIIRGVTVSGGNGEDLYNGGGINNIAAQVIFGDCRLVNNTACNGGGVASDGGGLTFIHCYLQRNSAAVTGGGISAWSCQIEISNSLLSGNFSGNDGGALFSDLSMVYLSSTTFADNTTPARGGAIYNYVGVNLILSNCILWHNSDVNGSGESAQIHTNPSNSVTVNHCCLQGLTGIFSGEGNIGDDPLFCDLPAGDFTTIDNSPCHNCGDNSMVSANFDLAHNPRIVNDVVDIGAYEFQGSSGIELEIPLPTVVLSLEPIYPNPARNSCRISFQTSISKPASVSIYSLDGRLVRRFLIADPDSAENGFTWNGRDRGGREVTSGIYLVKLAQDDLTPVSRLITLMR